MTKRIISIISLVLILAVCMVSTTSCLLIFEGLKEMEGFTPQDTPDGPGEGGEEGGETPDGPGEGGEEGGETPDGPGEGGEEGGEQPPHEHNYVDGKCECGAEDPNYVPPHVNSLAVGETNKIVIGDTAVDNGFGFLVESVFFVAEEKAHYEFTGDGLTILVYDSSMNNLCGLTGKADLEAGTYIICIAANTPATKGEFNVAVTKSDIPVEPPHVNKLVTGETNKIVITDALNNGYGYYIVWVDFTAEEKARYEFAAEGLTFFTYDAENTLVSTIPVADLEAGTYKVCIAFSELGKTGEADVTVYKVAIEEPVKDPFVFEAEDLEAAAEGTYTDGQKVVVGTNNYFTLIMSAKTKIDTSSKTWSDEYTSAQRLNFGGKTAWSSGDATVSKQGIMFTTSDAATIKVWWVCGGTGDRYIAIWDSTGKIVSATTVGADGDVRLDTLGVPAAGVYYLANPVNNNYIFKIEVTEGEAPAHEHVWSKGTCTEAQKCYCGETNGETAGHTEGAAATCTTSQICTVCEETLVAALGHNFVDGQCSRCGETESSGDDEGNETPATKEVLKYDAAGEKINANEETPFYSGTAFSVKLLGGSATPTSKIITAEDETEFSACLLPGGGGRSYEITANKSGTITLYIAVTNSTFATKAATVTYGANSVDIKKSDDGNLVVYKLEMTVESGKTYAVSTSAERLALFAIEFV